LIKSRLENSMGNLHPEMIDNASELPLRKLSHPPFHVTGFFRLRGLFLSPHIAHTTPPRRGRTSGAESKGRNEESGRSFG
jgi:hypothetical protein